MVWFREAYLGPKPCRRIFYGINNYSLAPPIDKTFLELGGFGGGRTGGRVRRHQPRIAADLAKAQNAPAYVVFSDRSLAEMAAHRPTSLSALREIHGVGDRKLERYGAAFLEVIVQNG